MSTSPKKVHNCNMHNCKSKSMHNTVQTYSPTRIINQTVYEKYLPAQHYTQAHKCTDARCTHSPKRYKYVQSKVAGNMKTQQRAKSGKKLRKST